MSLQLRNFGQCAREALNGANISMPMCLENALPSSKYDKDNYRGVTLLNVIGKLFERIILNRSMSYFENLGFPNELQFAYQKSKSSVIASFILQEAILDSVENGSNAYSCLLDSVKAFDTVWIDGLFYKLYNIGIRGKTWRLLRK